MSLLNILKDKEIFMAKFCSLYSSSSGNCTYIGSSHGGILIDIGVSAKKTAEALSAIGVDPSSIEAIFITHEHSDHIKGIKVFAAKHKIPVYASAGTLSGMEKLGAVDSRVITDIIPYSGIEKAGMFIRPFRTPHDSNESTGFSIITPDSKRICVATDIGTITDSVMEAIYGSDLILLESNHDVRMLQNGPYPYALKRRILSDIGHLSNVACAEMTAELVSKGTSRIFLGHLSKDNNFPDLAYQTNLSAIMEKTGAVVGRDFLMEVNKIENDKGIIRF